MSGVWLSINLLFAVANAVAYFVAGHHGLNAFAAGFCGAFSIVHFTEWIRWRPRP